MSNKNRQELNDGSSDEVTFGAAYGGELAVKVVMEIWRRLGVVQQEANEIGFFETAESFVSRFPDAGDEALEIELKPHFDMVLGEGEDPRGFRRLMAARLIRLMIEEFQRALDEEAQASVEGREKPVAVVEADEVSYLPEDDSDLSEMGQRQEAVSGVSHEQGMQKQEAVSALAHERGKSQEAVSANARTGNERNTAVSGVSFEQGMQERKAAS